MSARDVNPKVGRPKASGTTCDVEIAGTLADRLIRGASLKSACEAEGLPRGTVDGWMRKGEDGETEPYATFRVILKTALGEAKCLAEQRVYDGKGAWQAAARWLESLDRDQWQRSERREVEHSGRIEIPFPEPGAASARQCREAADQALEAADQALIEG